MTLKSTGCTCFRRPLKSKKIQPFPPKKRDVERQFSRLSAKDIKQEELVSINVLREHAACFMNKYKHERKCNTCGSYCPQRPWFGSELSS